MKIYLGADHRGFELKQQLLPFLQQYGEVIDLGSHEYNPEDDYNDVAIKVSEAILADSSSFGILLCGSAFGISIQANRFKGIRAIFGYTPKLAALGREHNDANILCLSADLTSKGVAEQIVDTFLNTNFIEEPRYIRRNKKLDGEF